MKATLEFNLPEEQEDFELKINAEKYRSVIWELQRYFRNKYKHTDCHELKLEEFNDCKKFFYDTLTECEVEL